MWWPYIILYEAARYMSGLLRAVMLWYYMKRPGICRDYSGLWCYDIIRSGQVYVRDYSGRWCYNIIRSGQVYVGITQGGDVISYMKRPGICRDYSGLHIILYEAARYMSGLLRAVMLWYYMKRPGICRDYSGLWCYILYEATRYMSGITQGCDVIS